MYYKLTIRDFTCLLSDFSTETRDYCVFHAIGDIFDINKENNQLFSFFSKRNDESLNSIYDVVHTISESNTQLEEVEKLMGRCHVTFPTKIENNYLTCDCENARCVVLTILRYLLLNNYKFKICQHCGKPFCIPISQRTSAAKYCERKSPLSGSMLGGSIEKSCGQAVKNARQECSRIRNRIETKAREARRGDNAFLDNFFKICEEFYSEQKKSPTADNINAYYLFLQKIEAEQGWIK